jgi:hypothetical protein
MVSVKDSVPKSTPKRTIKLTNVSLKESKFVDDEGDITADVIKALPAGIDSVDFKITIELDEDEVSEE